MTASDLAQDHVATAPRASAIRTLRLERAGIAALETALAVRGPEGLGGAFDAAVVCMSAAAGRTIVTGMGKSGHIGRKVAATMASTGTPAYFVHPGEASHGDLGMIRQDDVILALSWSGETAELADIITYAKRFSIPLIAITSSAESALGRQADVCLCLPKSEEACPNGLAPTTSTTMQLAVGDALAVALLEVRGFSASDFRLFHPGGKLGASLVPSKRAGDPQGALPHPHGTSNHAGLSEVERVAGAANTPAYHHHAHFRRSDGMDLWQEAKRWQTGREILLTGAG